MTPDRASSFTHVLLLEDGAELGDPLLLLVLLLLAVLAVLERVVVGNNDPGREDGGEHLSSLVEEEGGVSELLRPRESSLEHRTSAWISVQSLLEGLRLP